MTDRFQPLTIPERPASASVLQRRLTAGQAVIAIAVGVLSGAAAVYVHGRFGFFPAVASFFAMPLLFKLLALIHEVGHVLAGGVVGMQLLAISVGSWRWQRSKDGWQFGRVRSIKGIGGFALMLPLDDKPCTLEQSIYTLGGPVANFVLAVVCASGANTREADDVVGQVLLLLAIMSAAIGAINLLPLQFNGWLSDGRRLWALWRSLPEVHVNEHLLRLWRLSIAGVRPRDWPEFDALDADDKRLPQSIADGLRRTMISRSIDAGILDSPATLAAVSALATGFWQGPDGMRQMNAVALAMWEMVTRRDTTVAKAWLAEGEAALIDQSCERAWVTAAIAAAQGRLSEARNHIATARARLVSVADPGSQLMLTELLHRLELEIAGPP
ncbi:MAG: hypothetical protein HYX42_04725 [Polaromonas sp.]|uniref:M50 family metallopeptidase n=1 Tax=Polaromonas sp. TaxID=1869339 RepID=UPI0025CEA931|nr:M50 family metallopeptidase [Polaromonas sp.]MBI2725536.1 hypothetical protein [Polaromonas sp.]